MPLRLAQGLPERLAGGGLDRAASRGSGHRFPAIVPGVPGFSSLEFKEVKMIDLLSRFGLDAVHVLLVAFIGGLAVLAVIHVIKSRRQPRLPSRTSTTGPQTTQSAPATAPAAAPAPADAPAPAPASARRPAPTEHSPATVATTRSTSAPEAAVKATSETAPPSAGERVTKRPGTGTVAAGRLRAQRLRKTALSRRRTGRRAGACASSGSRATRRNANKYLIRLCRLSDPASGPQKLAQLSAQYPALLQRVCPDQGAGRPGGRAPASAHRARPRAFTSQKGTDLYLGPISNAALASELCRALKGRGLTDCQLQRGMRLAGHRGASRST